MFSIPQFFTFHPNHQQHSGDDDDHDDSKGILLFFSKLTVFLVWIMARQRK